jgi:beta-glucosidase
MKSSIVERRLKLIDAAERISLPSGFIFGAATAAYQIEGACSADGKGESIWDRFCRKPGVISDGSSGDIACDHYRRWREDIRLMGELGLAAYRFSVAWTRIQPSGRGQANRAGLAFYDQLIDGLLAAGVTPFLTLYHWDLPQALQDKGGWYNRDTSYRLAEYADIVSRSFGDRVKHWTTLNEPWTFCWSGHATGEDAPGLKDGARGGFSASHYALLGHGLSVPVIRNNVKDGAVGLVLDLNTVTPASGSSRDEAAARRFDGAQNRWFLEAVFKGHYPADVLDLAGDLPPEIKSDDNAIIAAPIDYLGVNIYRRSIMAHGDELPPLNFRRVSPPGRYTAVNYEIWPQCIHDVLLHVHENYQPGAIYVTENGMATGVESVAPDGSIPDVERAQYFVDHIGQMALAVAKGVPVKGYFAWTLIDNFEWAYGYTTPFGLVHVDFPSQRRRIKLSGEIYRRIAIAHSNR